MRSQFRRFFEDENVFRIARAAGVVIEEGRKAQRATETGGTAAYYQNVAVERFA